MEELEALAFGYGFPYIRLLILKELRWKVSNLSGAEDTPENKETILSIIDGLSNVIMTTKFGTRPFPSSVGDVLLMVSNRGDTLLYGAKIDTPIEHVPTEGSAEVTLHRTILEEVAQEIFSYITYYVMKVMQHADPTIYDMACDIFGCDRLVMAVEKLTIPLASPEPSSTIKQCLCLGFLKDTEEIPKLGKYCLTPTIN